MKSSCVYQNRLEGSQQLELTRKIHDMDKSESTDEDLPTDEEIEKRAHELYLSRREDGRDDGKAAVDDWLTAKKQLREERRKGGKS